MKRLLAFLTLGFACAALAQSGIVRVVANGNFGQGWMFLDVDARCKVVTPAHVVHLPGEDGRLASTISIIDGRGRTFFDAVVEVDPKDVDVTVFTVNSASDPQTCGTGRLSVVGMARRIANMKDAFVETTGPDQILRVPIRGRFASMDPNQGSLFTVKPVLDEDRIKKGWSGSIILDDDGPLGMIVDVKLNQNEAYAVRTDVIRRLIDASPVKPQQIAPLAASRAVPPIVLTTGSTDDGSTPAAMFAPGAAEWNVVPQDHQIAFVIVQEALNRLQRIRLSFKPTTNSVEGMDVSVSQAVDGYGWDSLKYCRPDGDRGTISCSILGAGVKDIRLSFKVSGDGPVALSGLTIE